MGVYKSIIIFNSSTPGFSTGNFVGSSAAPSQSWDGGRTALVVNAQAYSAQPGLNLQVQGPASGWINIGSSIIGDQVFSFDAPAGQYRLANLGASSVIGVNAVMVTVPYM